MEGDTRRSQHAYVKHVCETRELSVGQFRVHPFLRDSHQDKDGSYIKIGKGVEFHLVQRHAKRRGEVV